MVYTENEKVRKNDMRAGKNRERYLSMAGDYLTKQKKKNKIGQQVQPYVPAPDNKDPLNSWTVGGSGDFQPFPYPVGYEA